MTRSNVDIQVSSIAFGFSIGFGIWTLWEAVKQTRRNRNPLRSTYIHMIWGEILASLVIMVVGYLWIGGMFGEKPTVPLLFFILLAWVFQIQLLMQIIINRIAIISECQGTIRRMKWWTALIISCINIAVFCIFIPAHLDPPVSQLYVSINKYWDRTSKCLICVVDAALNYFFSRTVKKRLVEQHGLTKYRPLAKFNDRLMILSIGMDLMLIGLMSYPNPIVFVQFHPVTYLVKLNIEMSMANLITKVARAAGLGDDEETTDHHTSHAQTCTHNPPLPPHDNLQMKTFHTTNIDAGGSDEELDELKDSLGGIHRRVQVDVRVESANSARGSTSFEDEMSLTSYPGHPRSAGRRGATSTM
ncbi:hypothetical protein GGR52DRAFT_171316 [Hypoxylon sp. FL1284]|nr:hypothetical protein GGR52DRAFT_171316 [Hypoxylon sp. FL1284]